MSDSTTQQVKKSKADLAQQKVEDKEENQSPFEKEMHKKIRNKMKKLSLIQELESKIKKKEIIANEEQNNKIANKKAVEDEIAEVT